MPFTIDFLEEGVFEWSVTDDGAVATRVDDYTPTMYVGDGVTDLFGGTSPGRTKPRTDLSEDLVRLSEFLADLPAVEGVGVEQWHQTFRSEPAPVLRVDATSIDEITSIAHRVHQFGTPGTYTCYNVDFSREFRYCLERGCNPGPNRPLSTLSLALPSHTVDVEHVDELAIDGDPAGATTTEALETLEHRLRADDPDVLIVSAAALLPTLTEAARIHDVELQLGRRPGLQKLAGASTYESYGRVGHSPARYNVPGRAIIDRSNSFFFDESALQGCLDLVERSGKPLQELAWASIGNVLTAIQIHDAMDRGVLVPWKAWRPEFFKSARTLDDADRGGFTFAPEAGVHEDVHELDFSSLYPNIICTRNISPERIRCACHDRADVPGLGYSLCDEPGYLPDVLQPIIDDRDEFKAALRETDDPDQREALEGRSAALKWILVSCFGYQGFSNAKFGRIECHEAINAFAREILLDAKEHLEKCGWRVVHGIVDSLWVTPRDAESPQTLETVAAEISEATRIELEYEARYDWLAFVPMRDSQAGALTRYFGQKATEDGAGPTGPSFKYRGIECRQRSTPSFIADAQRALIRVFGETRSPERVCDRLEAFVRQLERGAVDPQKLVLEVRVSKRVEEYTSDTRTVAALRRAKQQDVSLEPGQTIAYVVADDGRGSIDRVRLAHESVERVDVDFYTDQLIRAAESVLSPVGWRERDIRDHLDEREESALTSFR